MSESLSTIQLSINLYVSLLRCISLPPCYLTLVLSRFSRRDTWTHQFESLCEGRTMLHRARALNLVLKLLGSFIFLFFLMPKQSHLGSFNMCENSQNWVLASVQVKKLPIFTFDMQLNGCPPSVPMCTVPSFPTVRPWRSNAAP